MKVNFNNVRLQAIFAYNRLVKKLNAETARSVAGDIVKVYPEDIRPHLDDLHNTLATIGCTYEDGNDEFKCILTDDIKLENFYPDEDEECGEE
jgi:hypothetical protein